jgi:hypothetical protein
LTSIALIVEVSVVVAANPLPVNNPTVMREGEIRESFMSGSLALLAARAPCPGELASIRNI